MITSISTSFLHTNDSVSVVLSYAELTHILSIQKTLLSSLNKDPSQAAAFIRKAYVISIGHMEEMISNLEAAKALIESKEENY